MVLTRFVMVRGAVSLRPLHARTVALRKGITAWFIPISNRNTERLVTVVKQTAQTSILAATGKLASLKLGFSAATRTPVVRTA